MKRIFFPLLLLCLFAVPGFSGNTVSERRPASEAYKDEETGIVFPAKLGGFVKTEVIRSFNPLIGTTIRYTGPDGGCADIYVYLLSARDQYLVRDDISAHHAELMKAIRTLPEKIRPVLQVRVLSENKLSGFPFHGQETVFSIQTGNGEIRNVLLLLGIRRHVLKLRFSSGNRTAEAAFPAFRKAFLDLCADAM